MTRTEDSGAMVGAGSDPESWYQRFSLEVGLRDWVVPNPRHEQLKRILADVLEGASDLRILDVGCGTGVMSGFLTRFGDVMGTDFSKPAIELAQRMVPRAHFRAGPAEEALQGGEFDLVTLFDVIEHVPPGDRRGLLSGLRRALRPGGTIVASSPHPRFTRWMHEERPDLLQVVDEPVEPAELVDAGARAGLELSRYETYDIDRGGPQYQLFVFAEPGQPGGPPRRRRSLDRRLRSRTNGPARVLRRVRLGAHVARHGNPRLGLWLLAAKGRPRSLD